MQKTFTCIMCPKGCRVKLTVENDEVIKVEGNECPLGARYAIQEFKNPLRVVTTTVRIKGAALKRLPVKTAKPIPKSLIKECLRTLSDVEVKAPIKCGEVIVKNVCGTGIDVVATREMVSLGEKDKEMEDKMQLFSFLLGRVKEIIGVSCNGDEKFKAICQLLIDNVSYYNWVGLYILDESKKELVLGPYVGKPTEHVRIPVGKGICGQAAEKMDMFIVQDVSKEANYLSCNPEVRSEIVVPIFKNKKILGELDIDSNALSPFTKEDREFLEKVCKMCSECF